MGGKGEQLTGAVVLGGLVREFRQRALLTQEELAERSGVSIRTIRELEAGRRTPRSESVRLLADALGLAGWARAQFDAAAWRSRRGQASPSSLPPTVGVVPAQLPADVADFTGRVGCLAQLDALLAEGQQRRPVVILAIAGVAGAGKTALAVHWAHRVADRFPDGQLYVDLRGYAPGPPLGLAQALGLLLGGLGVAAEHVPVGLQAAAGLYRSLLAGRRVLVVLDNARDAAQVRPLLPGSPGCVVVVTSRDRLDGLVASHGAWRLVLPALPASEALELLRRIVGVGRVAAEAAAAELTEVCGRLPLALRIAAANLAAHPELSITGYLRRLRAGDRLAGLAVAGDPSLAVGVALDCSAAALDGPSRRLFGLLGLVPGPGVSAGAAAALAGIPLPQAAEGLERLAAAHLLVPQAGGRWGFHDLLRHYARQRASRYDQPTRHAATQRLLDWYLAATAAAMDVVAPYERQRRPQAPEAVNPVPSPGDRAAAMAWLDDNRSDLVAAATYAADGWPEHAIALCAVLWRYFEIGAHHAEAMEVHHRVLQAAVKSGDRAAEAATRRRLGVFHDRCGRFNDAVDELQQALDLFQELGDRGGAAQALASLGGVSFKLGRYEHAWDCQTRAVELFTELGDRVGVGTALGTIAGIYDRWGRYEEAIDHAQRALEILDEIGDRAGAARTLGNLGTVYERLGRYDEAMEHYRRCLCVFREIGNRTFQGRVLGHLASVNQRLGRHLEALEMGRQALATSRGVGDREGEVEVLAMLGRACRGCGRHDEAVEHHAAAVDLAVELGDRSHQADALNGLGQALLDVGRPDEALTRHRAALAVARAVGDRFAQARALDGVAQAEWRSGRLAEARTHWQESLTRYAELGVPEAQTVRERLAALVTAAP